MVRYLQLSLLKLSAMSTELSPSLGTLAIKNMRASFKFIKLHELRPVKPVNVITKMYAWITIKQSTNSQFAY